jgi:hypothetical protein
MQARDFTDVTLPPQAVANSEFPYERQVASARRFLAARGITEVRPLYGAKFPRTDVPASASRTSSPPTAGAAGVRAHARWFDARCA